MGLVKTEFPGEGISVSTRGRTKQPVRALYERLQNDGFFRGWTRKI
jgi:hypothetical protein